VRGWSVRQRRWMIFGAGALVLAGIVASGWAAYGKLKVHRARALLRQIGGTDVAAQVRKTGYRFARFGENLYAGPWGRVSARQVVSAWLASPPHRANLLSPDYRELGVAPAKAAGLLGSGESVLWTAAFATPS